MITGCCPITFSQFELTSACTLLFLTGCCPIISYFMLSLALVTQKTPRSFNVAKCLKSQYALSNTTISPALILAQTSHAILGSESFALEGGYICFAHVFNNFFYKKSVYGLTNRYFHSKLILYLDRFFKQSDVFL